MPGMDWSARHNGGAWAVLLQGGYPTVPGTPQCSLAFFLCDSQHFCR
jgi:hypothetical protein